jgi:hypothetical protein
VKDASALLADVESTARPILPRAIAIAVLIAFVLPTIVAAASAFLSRR